MKRLFPIWAFLALLLAGGCSKYDDSMLTGRVNDLERRMKELETLCKETNTNISSLQTLVSAIQNGDYVKEVTPVIQDGKEIGYTITFDKSDPITIYHGTGNNTEGDGAMPVIGVRQDEDEAYYWTLNDVWLLSNGNKVQVRSTLPQLKLQNECWYLSNDGQQAWQQLGIATEADCDKTFQSVTQDDYNVYIFLASGEKIIVPKTSGLSISFQEGNSLLFNVDETKTIHYTITGGGQDNVVKAEMLNNDGGYTLHTTSTSATTGTITIQTKVPTENRVIVSVSDGNHTIMAAIDVSAPSFDGKIVQVETPGTLKQLLAEYNQSTISELTVSGSINEEDIATLAALPKLLVLDIENTDITRFETTFYGQNLTSIKLPKTLTEIRLDAFWNCYRLTSVTIPSSVTSIRRRAFAGCYRLATVYCKANTPPKLGIDVFPEVPPSNCVLFYVPTGSAEAYRTAEGWKDYTFKEIIETNF